MDPNRFQRLEQQLLSVAHEIDFGSDLDRLALPHSKNSIWPPESQFLVDYEGPAVESNGGDGFFQNSEWNVASAPAKLADMQQSRSDNLDNLSAFEFLCRWSLRYRTHRFTYLSPRQQALAKVGGLLHMHAESYTHSTYRFTNMQVLVAVLVRSSQRFYVRRDIPVMDYSEMSVAVGADGAVLNDKDFELIPLHDAIWMFGQFDPEAMLDIPSQMGTKWLLLRQLPDVSPELLQPSQLQLLRKLLLRPMRFETLRRKLPKSQHSALLSDLATLALTRSVALLNYHP